jgi:hypothetical protein
VIAINKKLNALFHLRCHDARDMTSWSSSHVIVVKKSGTHSSTALLQVHDFKLLDFKFSFSRMGWSHIIKIYMFSV